MPTQSNFVFISDEILRTNLDRAFDHLVELVTLSESPEYTTKPTLQSSFRKTIIIYTASIVEALLLYILKKHKTEDELHQTRKEFKISRRLNIITANQEEVVLGKYKDVVEKCRFEKLNLDQINKLCFDHGLIKQSLYDSVDKLREQRNRMHIGSLSTIELEYTKADLESVFKVAGSVKNAAKILP